MTMRPRATPIYIPTLEDSASGLASPRLSTLVPLRPRDDLESSSMSLWVITTGTRQVKNGLKDF